MAFTYELAAKGAHKFTSYGEVTDYTGAKPRAITLMTAEGAHPHHQMHAIKHLVGKKLNKHWDFGDVGDEGDIHIEHNGKSKSFYGPKAIDKYHAYLTKHFGNKTHASNEGEDTMAFTYEIAAKGRKKGGKKNMPPVDGNGKFVSTKSPKEKSEAKQREKLMGKLLKKLNKMDAAQLKSLNDSLKGDKGEM